MTHTPGPWTVKDRNDSPQFGLRQIVDASGRHIGDVTRDEAALIAAAPDLLAAIKAAHSPSAHLGFGIVGTRGDAYVWGMVDYNADRSCAACAAIAKAEGTEVPA